MLTAESPGNAAPGMYRDDGGPGNESLDPAGRRFVRRFAATQAEGTVPTACYIPETAQATETLLAAIERSNGTRASVRKSSTGSRSRTASSATFSFDENGDMTPATISVYRSRAEGRRADAPDFYRGADFDRVVQVPRARPAVGKALPARARPRQAVAIPT